MTEHSLDAAWAHPGQPPAESQCEEQSEAERLALLDGLKAQIRSGVYHPDIRDLARSLANMIVRDL